MVANPRAFGRLAVGDVRKARELLAATAGSAT
jgi:hypothetical protein